MEQKDNETLGLKAIIVKYLREWKLFVIAFVISIIPAVLYLVLYPRTYEIMARVQITDEQGVGGTSFGLGEAAGLMKSFGLGGSVSGGIIIEDEVRNILTNSLLKGMVLDLGINVEYTEPLSFFRIYEPPYIVTTDSATEAKLDEEIEFKIRVSGNTVKVTSETDREKKKFEFTSLPGVMTLKQGTFVLNANTSPEADNTIKKLNVAYRPAGFVAEDLEDEMLVEEASKTSNIIELVWTDHEKQRGKDMLNTLIAKYNEKTSVFSKEDADKTIGFLDGRIDSLITDLRDVEARIALYKNENRLTDIAADVLFYADQMKELQVKIIELEAQGHMMKMMDDFVKDPANKYTLAPMLMTQEGGESSPITLYNQALLERARVIQNSSMSNPLVATLTEKADNLRESVFASITNAQRGIELSTADLKQREKELYNLMGSYPEQERDFIELKREQEILQGVYLILLQKREESALGGNQIVDRARVLDEAYVKARPIGPRKLYAAIFMMLLTLVLPVGYLFCKEQYRSLKEEFENTKKEA